MEPLVTLELERLKDKLLLLAEIKPGFTLSTSTMQIIDHRVFTTSLFRWYNGENRVETLEKIEEILQEGGVAYLETKDEEFKGLLEKALDGVRNLLLTYEDEASRERINSLLEPLEKLVSNPLDEFLTTNPLKENKKNFSSPILFEPEASPEFGGSPSPENWQGNLGRDDDFFNLNGRMLKKVSLPSCPLHRVLFLNQEYTTFIPCMPKGIANSERKPSR